MIPKKSKQAWADYEHTVRSTNHFNSYHFGSIDLALAEKARGMLLACDRQVFRNDDFTPGFYTVDHGYETADKLNETSSYIKFSQEASWVMADILDAMKQDVASALGSPWKVLCVRAWTTMPNATPMGPYGWHTDGFVPQVIKIMLYLTPVDEAHGGIEFQNQKTALCGPPGTWAVFLNSTVEHRGLPGKSHERLAVEITLCRSPEYDLRPKFPGLNSHWPLSPEIENLEGFTGQVKGVKIRERLDRRVGIALISSALALVSYLPLHPKLARMAEHRKAGRLRAIAENVWIHRLKR